MMQEFYRIDDDEDQDAEKDNEKPELNEEQMNTMGNKFYDEDGQFNWNPNQASSDESSSSGSDISESDDEGSEDENSEIWQDENADIPQGETVGNDNVGTRIALNKMDWDVVTAVDILALFKGLC